ncbi:MAG: histidine phosphatase family protein [Leptolyngbya sp. SIOISBB]|nr:histidine phosphatase family protein [Leptolyngbya sp. SIOISBB]
MLKLLLMRHGESISNRDRRMAGQDHASLTDSGHQQCQQLAAWLHKRNWHPTHIYSSPLNRALESVEELLLPWQWQLRPEKSPTPETEVGEDRGAAMLIPLFAKGPQAAPQFLISHHLQEFQAGILTGLTWPEAQQRYPNLCRTLETSLDWVPIPAAETPHQGKQRAQALIEHLLAHHGNGDAVWVMAHQWILEHLIAVLLGSDRTWQITMPNTALFEFWLDRDRWSQSGMARHISDLWQIKRFNDCPHLNTANE